MQTSAERACVVCDGRDIESFVTIKQVPVHCNLLWDDQTAARTAHKGDIELGFCHQCGHVFNLAFDPDLMSYDQAYENSLHFSPRFQAFAEGLAQSLIDRYDLHGKEIVETGAGQGDFLRLLVERGDNRGWGFDAAYLPKAEDEQDERLTFVQGFDWWNHIDHAPDMIYTRHVLEHIETPLEFVGVMRDKIGSRPDTLVFFEMPNMAYTLRALAIWDIIYEHCGYYSSHSLSYLFRRAGFNVLRTDEVYAGQFLTIEALPASADGDNTVPTADLTDMQAQVAAFGVEFAQKVAEWQAKLAEWEREGKRVVAWGSGSKGVTFLNVLKADSIQYIVDINPRKLGKFVVGTGQEIISPDFLKTYKPDVVILMNPIYQEEIAGMMAEMGLTAVIDIA